VPNVGKQVPMKRPGQPAELATAFVMLADPLSSYVSGATIAVTVSQSCRQASRQCVTQKANTARGRPKDIMAETAASQPGRAQPAASDGHRRSCQIRTGRFFIGRGRGRRPPRTIARERRRGSRKRVSALFRPSCTRERNLPQAPPLLHRPKIRKCTPVKIAQISPLIESVPPRLYGGTERVVAYLTDELVRQGHDVTLFASRDSRTSAKLIPGCRQALRLDPDVREYIPYHLLMMEQVKRLAPSFDILHFHTDLVHFPVFSGTGNPTLTTLHGRQDLFELPDFYKSFPDMPLVSISDAQRKPIPDATFAGTVLHGLPADLLPPTLKPCGDYLAFVGRISPEKGVDRAIQIAHASGMPLKIAAKVDRADEAYFRERIAPLLNSPGVKYIGEINERQKARFLGEAAALLSPIDWPEPFGLVMIEAMACATPVVAFEHGSVREVIDHKVTGWIVGGIEEAIRAVRPVIQLERKAVRRRFEQRFTARRMADDYVRLYHSIIAKRSSANVIPMSRALAIRQRAQQRQLQPSA
jgi:glycosyltransferase involved in cell wall biosynthesis